MKKLFLPLFFFFCIVCSGSSTILAESESTSYTWNGAPTEETLAVSLTGVYTITVTDFTGCKESFVTTIGSSGVDEGNQFIGYQNGFLISGTSNSKFILMHIDENGEINWSYELDVFQNITERATNMLIDGDHVLVVGNSETTNGSNQCFALKFNLISKTLVWVRIYSGVPYQQSYFSSILNSDTLDHYFILGQTWPNSSPGLGCDALWLKINKNSGSVEAAKNLNLGSCETYSASIIASNGYIYSAGRFNYDGGGLNRLRGSLTKLDFDGNEIWSKLYSKNVISVDARLYFQSVAEDNGSLILGGQGDLSGTSTSNVDVLFVKTNLEGELIWHKEINIQGVNTEYFTKVSVTDDAYYLMINAITNGRYNYYIIKTDKNGNLIWSKKYGKQNSDRGHDIIVTNSNIFVVGETNSFGVGNYDILLVKSDLEGNGLNEMCDILSSVNVNSKNSVLPFQGKVTTNEFNIDFPLVGKTVQVAPINLTKIDLCSYECQDTCQNGLVLHSVPDAAINNVIVECNGGKSFEVTISLCNLDSVTLNRETPFVVYDSNPLTGFANVVFQSKIDIDLLRDMCDSVKFNVDLNEGQNYFIIVNDNGSLLPPFSLDTDFPSTNFPECNYQNNILGFFAKNSDTTYITRTLIFGESIQIGQEFYDTQGNYVQNLSNIFGCDSTLLITINTINADIVYDFNNCSAIVGSTNMDYAEFVPSKKSNISCGTIISSNIYRENPIENKHSCTPGIGNSMAMCVESKTDCVYSAGHERSVIFSLEITPNNDEHIQVNGLRFFEKAPLEYDWINGPNGINNYPLKFGIRILKNNIEIFRLDEIETLRDWNEKKFDFSNDEAFIVKDKSTYTFEFLAYCPVGNTSQISVWDLENLSIFTSCIEKGSRILSGKIDNIEGSPLSNVSVIKQQNLDFENIKTDSNGLFSFFDFETTDECNIFVSKNDDFLNGISTIDLILIQKHILGLEIFDDSRKYVAGDINNDTKISSADLVELRKLILGITDRFTSNKSWKFCTELPQFNQFSKIQVNENYKISGGINDLRNLNFTGIKIGDINNDHSFNASAETRYNHIEELKYAFEEFKNNEKHLQIFLTSNNELNGLQVSFDIDEFEVLGIKSEQINIGQEHIFIKDGKINISYSSPEFILIDKSKPVFTVVLQSRGGNAKFKGLNSNFKNEIYFSDLIERRINLNSLENSKIFDLVTAKPNPFKNGTVVEFYSSETNPVNVEIYNIAGSLLYSKSLTSSIGLNEIQILADQLGNLSGVYIVRLISGSETHSLKLILN